MNAPSIGPKLTPAPTPTSAVADMKRAALQAALLKKSVQSQQTQSDQMQREAEGKGRIIDLRV
jgi:hypothetical protein